VPKVPKIKVFCQFKRNYNSQKVKPALTQFAHFSFVDKSKDHWPGISFMLVIETIFYKKTERPARRTYYGRREQLLNKALQASGTSNFRHFERVHPQFMVEAFRVQNMSIAKQVASLQKP